MQLKKTSIYILVILLVVFAALLLVATGVKYQEPLNKWNNKVFKGEINHLYASLYLNNYSPIVETWNLSNMLGEQILTTNQYGKEVLLGGLITGAKVTDNKIYLGFNSGAFLELSKEGQLIKKQSISELLQDFELAKSNGGVRSILWINDDLIFVYYTAKNLNMQTFTIRAALINTNDFSLLDDLELGQFSINEHFALGGGAVYQPQKNRVLLAIGSASAADNLNSNAKSQDSISLFGKVVNIPLIENMSKFLKPSIYTKGHRNPQGMALIENKIYLVEHGPKGGDEINIIKENGNYGWNKFSYGTKYGIPDNSYDGYSDEFTEPTFYFTPSIGISDVESCPKVLNDPGYNNCILVSSMKDGSFYILKPHKRKNTIQSIERIEHGSRIRKIRSSDKSIYLFTDNQSIVKINYAKL
jgi:aldose sugar dehydrogenase